MAEIIPYGAQEWVERISDHELPALCSTIKEIEKLSKDDVSSLAKLGQSVMHDHALTSAILKVANSANYMGRNPVTTVSRASVVLGLTTLKNICLTAKLLYSLLRTKKLTPRVYERLLMLMAQSFHAGMLARMMLQDLEEDLQEEVFIAALLNRFGESAFWSIGGRLTVELDDALRKQEEHSAADREALVRERLGTSFREMSLGLASSWNMGRVLISSLENPETRTPELRSVTLAVELSEVLADPRHSDSELERLYQQVASLMGADKKMIPVLIEECTEKTVDLMHSYGVGMLTRFLNQGEIPEAQAGMPDQDQGVKSDQALQLKMLRELAFLPNEKADFNLIVQTAMEGIHRGIGMKRTLALLRTRDRKWLAPRFVSAAGYEEVRRQFRVPLAGEQNIFTHVINTRAAVQIEKLQDPQWYSLITPVRKLIGGQGFFVAPIIWGKQCVGVIYADRSGPGQREVKAPALTDEDYMAFTLFTQQANLCLSQVVAR